MDIKLWREILDPYYLAVDELLVKFNHIIREHRNYNQYSPIDTVIGRVNSISSILVDKDTSGVIIIAKNPETHEFLSRQFRDKTTRKTYVAIVRGRLPKKHDTIDTYIVRDRQNRKKFTVPSGPKGKQAITEYKVEKEFGNYTFVSLFPHTGRTHQLRVHMQHLNAPILGDPV